MRTLKTISILKKEEKVIAYVEHFLYLRRRNMSCNCIKTTSIVLGVGKVTLNTEEFIPENLKSFCLVIAQKIPEGATIEKVEICPIGQPSYELRSVSGNYIRIDQLRCRKGYPVIFGDDPNHYSLKVKVPNTGYEVV